MATQVSPCAGDEPAPEPTRAAIHATHPVTEGEKAGRSPSRPAEQRTEQRAEQRLAKQGWLARLGPGLIAGASDDDPSGIATYSQVGAQFGFRMLWTMPFSLPLMAAVQEISARLGRVTGRGIAGNIRRHYPAWVGFPLVLLLLFANVLNIGADIGAIGSACALLVPGAADNRMVALGFAVAFGLLSLLLQVFLPYTGYCKYLKWLTPVLFTYVATAIYVGLRHHDPLLLREVVHGSLVPSLDLGSDSLKALIAVLGTTISPYLFFWQASQETEELKANPDEQRLKEAPRQARSQFGRIRFDTYLGMALSNAVAWFIIVTAALTLYRTNGSDIDTAAKAAEALKPLAGKVAFLLFAVGIVGTGLMAVPVLAGSAAYAVGELLHWRVGLDRKPEQAKGFYGVLAVATLVGIAINFTRINPMKALIWAAILNGLASVPVMVVMMLMIRNPEVMGKFTRVGRWLRLMGWLATAVMAAAAVGMLVSMGK